MSSDSTGGLTPTLTEPMLALDVNTTITITARRRRCDTVLAGGGDAEITSDFGKLPQRIASTSDLIPTLKEPMLLLDVNTTTTMEELKIRQINWIR